MQLSTAKGVYAYDTDGNKYLDFYGGHCVCPLGHSPESISNVIKEQADKFMFYSNLANIPIREEGAEKLIKFNNSGHHKVFFCNSGGEANENALKIAVKYTGRKKIAGFKNGFHGRTSMAMSATDNTAWHGIYHPWMGNHVQLEPNNIDDLFHITEEIAAVILEPIQSIGKCTVFEFEYLKELRKRCDQSGTLLIFDEVQTGMGRTGLPAVSGNCGVTPDLMTMAKGLASGFPIGAVTMIDEVASKLQKGDMGATFGGGPLAMAAMMETIHQIEKNNLIDQVIENEKYIREVFSNIPEIKEIKGKGLLLGLKLDQEAKTIQEKLFDKNIIVGLNSDPKQIHLLPPFTIEKKHIDQLAESLKELL
ncbi:UNVERIFIED_CONTAM: hypothetical protein GTU68_022220 [Idotea baltica]|nr:hypothetical protein [Idotea baltica]